MGATPAPNFSFNELFAWRHLIVRFEFFALRKKVFKNVAPLNEKKG